MIAKTFELRDAGTFIPVLAEPKLKITRMETSQGYRSFNESLTVELGNKTLSLTLITNEEVESAF